MTQVELDDDDRKQRAMKAAAEQVALDALIEKKRSHNRKWNEEINQAEKLISQLSTEADSGKAWVPAQVGMFGDAANDDDEPSDDEQPAPRKRGRGRRGAAAAGAVA